MREFITEDEIGTIIRFFKNPGTLQISLKPGMGKKLDAIMNNPAEMDGVFSLWDVNSKEGEAIEEQVKELQ